MCVSVLILTRNEEINIRPCLKSVSWSDDVVVLDSVSTDRTQEIALSLGARVVERPFDDYATQRNFGLKQIHYKNKWLLIVDADERVPADLRQEILEALDKVDESVTLFRVRGKNFLYGRWIRRSSGYPTWFGRLVRPTSVYFARSINEELHTDGRSRLLHKHFLHYPFNKGFSSWIAKHNLYSTMEAELLDHQGPGPLVWKDLFAGDPAARRRAAKTLLYRLPARPLIAFLGLYVFRGGFMEGRAGLTYACLRAAYEHMIDCKYHELRRRKRSLPT